jgi:hypothetical protein
MLASVKFASCLAPGYCKGHTSHVTYYAIRNVSNIKGSSSSHVRPHILQTGSARLAGSTALVLS